MLNKQILSLQRKLIELDKCIAVLEAKASFRKADILIKKLRSELQGHLKSLNSGISYIRKLQSSKDPQEDIRSAQRHIIATYSQVLREIHQDYLQFLDQPASDDLPVELIPVLNRFLKQIVRNASFSLGINTCLRPTIYQCKRVDLKEFSKYPKSFHILLTFPRIEERNALNHCMFFHEVGHVFDDFFKVSESLIIKKSLKEIVTSWVERVFKSRRVGRKGQISFGEVFDKERYTTDKYEVCLEILKNWIAEYVADMYACKILGPAYFFAFFERAFSSEMPINGVSKTHPDSYRRLNFIAKCLKKLGFSTEISSDQYLQKLKETHSIVSGYDRTQYSDNYAIADICIGEWKVEDELLRILDKDEMGAPFTREKYDKANVPSLAETLAEGLLPCEIQNEEKSPATISEILNAGWFVFLCKWDDFCKETKTHLEVEDADYLTSLNELLLKTIESSEILRTWKG